MTHAERVERGLKGLEFVSTGLAPNCDQCAAKFGMDRSHYTSAWIAGEVVDEGSFSMEWCGICGSTRGGNRYVWHGCDRETGRIYHFDDACTDCVVFITYGQFPDDEKGGD